MTPNANVRPNFFSRPAAFRRWLELNHDRERELVVGFWKTSTGKPSMTWPESVDEALCFGWIDGVRRSLGDESYTIRFTPRRRGSVWSAVNVRRARELIELGRMTPAGLKAFEARRANRSGIYSYEQRSPELPEPYAEGLRANAAAWEFFQSRPASYRKAAMWWIVSAKKEETRLRRLTMLIEESARGRTVKPLNPPSAR